MRDGWRSLVLGEVLTLEYGKALTDKDRDGGVFPVFGSAGQVGGHSHHLGPDGPMIIVGRKGTAGAVHWSSAPGWPIDTAYWVRPLITQGLDFYFLFLLLQHLDLPGVCAQTGVPGLNRDRAYELAVDLPPLDEQRRIVDLIGGVDEAVSRSAAVGREVGVLLRVHLDSLEASSTRRLGDLMAIGSGPSWKSDQEHAAPVAGGLSVIGITNTRPDGRLNLAERRYVVGLPPKVKVLTDHSLIMIRTNGNRQRIGNIYRTTPEAVGSAVSAFQIAMEPTADGIADFLYWVLRRPSVQSLISESASGTTGLGNVAVKWLRELELPWPEDSERMEYVQVAEALLRVQETSENEASELRQLRSALLGQLLSGDYEIPDAYDALLESA